MDTIEFGRIPIWQANRQTNVHSNVVSVWLFYQELRFGIHWSACLSDKEFRQTQLTDITVKLYFLSLMFRTQLLNQMSRIAYHKNTR